MTTYSVNNQTYSNTANINVHIESPPCGAEVRVSIDFDNIGSHPPPGRCDTEMSHDLNGLLDPGSAAFFPEMQTYNGGGSLGSLMRFELSNISSLLRSLVAMMNPFSQITVDVEDSCSCPHAPPPANHQPASPENTAKAARTLLNDPAVTNGPITQDGLQQIVDAMNPDGTPKYASATRDAAQYLLDHPDEFANVESAGQWQGQAPDGILGRNGMRDYLNNEHHTARQDLTDNAWTALKDAGITDGTTKPTMQQLRDTANGRDADGNDAHIPQATRNAAQYFIDNPGELGNVASPENTKNAAQTLLDDPHLPNGPITHDGLKQQIIDAMNPDGTPKYAQTTRDAAQYLYDNPAEFTNVESAGAWQDHAPDGILGRNGMRDYLNNEHHSASQNLTDGAKGVLTNAGITINGTTRPTMQQLRNIANGKDAHGRPTNVSQATRNAAQYFIDNPEEL